MREPDQTETEVLAVGKADELLYAEHTKKWILSPIAHRACRHSSRIRTSPES
jgi:hypothetical protein